MATFTIECFKTDGAEGEHTFTWDLEDVMIMRFAQTHDGVKIGNVVCGTCGQKQRVRVKSFCEHADPEDLTIPRADTADDPQPTE